MNKLFIISRYEENLDWLKSYNFNYLIYNKGKPIEDPNIINIENIGGNQIDIFRFIYDHYEDLPDVMVFIQAHPFDHCRKELFDLLINNIVFTPLEYYGKFPANSWERRTEEGGYLEINNNWYIKNNNDHYNITCRYSSFDEFMNKYFNNYEHIEWIRFSPGSQYIVERMRVLHYPREFWRKLMDELNSRFSTEGHIIERSLWTIFQCNLTLR